MLARPLVTVLLATFNDAAFLAGAVDSILRQTLRDLELLIVDDGSTDETADLLRSLADSRVRVVRNDRNLGLTCSLKRGMDLAEGKYVARLDSDDIALPRRLEQQVAFLEAHPDVAIVGSAIEMIDTDGHARGVMRVPTGDLEIRWASLLVTPFAHPTVMLRRQVLARHALNYDQAYRTAQDYDLWTRLLRHARGANLAQPLVRYRLRCGLTAAQRQDQLRNCDAIALRNTREVLPDLAIDGEEIRRLRRLFEGGDRELSGSLARLVNPAERYLDMLAAFTRRYRGEQGLMALRRREALRVARLVHHYAFWRGSTHLLLRLVRTDPAFPFTLAGAASLAVIRRVCRLLRVRPDPPDRREVA